MASVPFDLHPEIQCSEHQNCLTPVAQAHHRFTLNTSLSLKFIKHSCSLNPFFLDFLSLCSCGYHQDSSSSALTPLRRPPRMAAAPTLLHHHHPPPQLHLPHQPQHAYHRSRRRPRRFSSLRHHPHLHDLRCTAAAAQTYFKR